MAKKTKKSKPTSRHRQKPHKVSGPQGSSSPQGVFQEALALHQAGHLTQAETLYRQILLSEPGHPEALHYLGLLAYQLAKSDIAVQLINEALSCRPDYVDALINLGIVLKSQGRLEEAVASYRKALALKPDNAQAHYNLGNALNDQGKTEKAAASYRQALTLEPGYVDALVNLGIALKDMGRQDEAVACYRQALALNPGLAKAHYNLGIALNDRGMLEEAVASYRQALTLRPDYMEAYINLGITLNDLGRLEEAVACYRQALALKSDFADTYNNLGLALYDQDKLDEAAASYRQALSLKPDFAEAHNNLGNTLNDQGRFDEAVASYRQAISLKPNYAQAYSNLLICLNYQSNISQEAIYKESLQFGDIFADTSQTEARQYSNSLQPDRKLRIGYVSPDLRLHSVGFFIEPVMKAHNRERMEIFCYANVKKPDRVTQRLQAETDYWLSIVGMKHEAVADRILRDGIDILVDLAGHTRDNSLPVFARKPAPVQVTWLGYPNTTGLRTIDYRLTDAVADPPGEADTLHNEKLIRLEHGFLCYQPGDLESKVGPLPCRERGFITFGSFNNLTKVTPEVIKVWARILQEVPDSRLLLKSRQLMNEQTSAGVKEMFAREGIAEERLEMHSWFTKQADHLGLYRKVDIGLDPFPYNGTTTTCEALWMGVPVVALRGGRHAGRVGASILSRVGLEELVASSVEEYIAVARALALNRKRLQEMHESLRGRMQASELMDSKLFTTHLEDVYRQLWAKYCESAPGGQ